jgi:hypothetical protein
MFCAASEITAWLLRWSATMSTTRRILGPWQPLDAALIGLTTGSLAVSFSLAVSHPMPSDEVRGLLRVTTLVFVSGFASIVMLVFWSRARGFIRVQLRSRHRNAAAEARLQRQEFSASRRESPIVDSASTIESKPPASAPSRRDNGKPPTGITRQKNPELPPETPEASTT